MLNIVIPMAGAGSRFAKVGYKDPKPLIPIHGVPMIQLIIANIRPIREHRFIFICQHQHVQDYGLREKLSAWAPGSTVIELDKVTQGAACTVLEAKSLINTDDPLMIANSDQYVDVDINDYLFAMEESGWDGFIMTLNASDERWSFVGFDNNHQVERLVEKQVISDEATTGVYNFARGKDFVACAEAMIAADLREKGEFYVAPVYNQLIARKGRIGVYNIGAENDGMYVLGTPPDFEAFVKNPLSQDVVRNMK